MAENWVFLNEEFKLERLAAISVTDRGFLFGEGIFTTMRIHQGKVELGQAHLNRLQQQAETLNFYLPPLQLDWLPELIQRNQAEKGTWRLKIIVTIKQEWVSRTVDTLLVTLHPYDPSSSTSCRLCLFPHAFESPLASVKSLSYLNHLYMRNYAHQRGYDDAITQTQEGFLLETSCSNLFWIDQGTCWIPDQSLPYLKGVFLNAFLPHLSLPIRFTKANLEQVPSSASVYSCNALTHVRPVSSIHAQEFPRNPIWEEILQKAITQALQ